MIIHRIYTVDYLELRSDELAHDMTIIIFKF
jgi:hypothetical protein